MKFFGNPFDKKNDAGYYHIKDFDRGAGATLIEPHEMGPSHREAPWHALWDEMTNYRRKALPKENSVEAGKKSRMDR